MEPEKDVTRLDHDSVEDPYRQAWNHMFGLNGYEKSTLKGIEGFRRASETGNVCATVLPWISRNAGGATSLDGSPEEAAARDLIEKLRSEAENGKADAQFILGRLHEMGLCMEQSHEKAAEWYTLAAEQGLPMAQNNLGILHRDGLGVKKDLGAAAERFRQAAEQGHADAQNNLGRCHMFGYGVKRSGTEAMRWFEKAADQNHPGAMHNIATCYRYAQGVEWSFARSFEWELRAAELGCVAAQLQLGEDYDERLSEEERREEILEEHATHLADFDGDWEAYRREKQEIIEKLKQWEKDIYLGAERTREEAIRWFRLAAGQGNEAGLLRAASWYVAQARKEHDWDLYEEALRLYLQVFVENDAETSYRLGLLHEYRAKETYRDVGLFNEALKWYRLAAGHNRSSEDYVLGEKHEAVARRDQDFEEYDLAMDCYRMAANDIGVRWKVTDGQDYSMLLKEIVDQYHSAACERKVSVEHGFTEEEMKILEKEVRAGCGERYYDHKKFNPANPDDTPHHYDFESPLLDWFHHMHDE